MNAEDFEKQLERQPLRTLPSEWREQILECAQIKARARRAPIKSQSQRWWRELLWPCPQAWAGVAAVWLVIVGLHFIGGSEPRPDFQLSASPPPPEFKALLAEQRKLFAELLPPPDPPPVIHHGQPADRPRSKNNGQPGPPTAKWLELPPNHFFV